MNANELAAQVERIVGRKPDMDFTHADGRRVRRWILPFENTNQYVGLIRRLKDLGAKCYRVDGSKPPYAWTNVDVEEPAAAADSVRKHRRKHRTAWQPGDGILTDDGVLEPE